MSGPGSPGPCPDRSKGARGAHRPGGAPGRPSRDRGSAVGPSSRTGYRKLPDWSFEGGPALPGGGKRPGPQRGRDLLGASVGPDDLDRDPIARLVGQDQVPESVRGADRLTVEGDDHVAGPDAGLVGG